MQLDKRHYNLQNYEMLSADISQTLYVAIYRTFTIKVIDLVVLSRGYYLNT